MYASNNVGKSSVVPLLLQRTDAGWKEVDTAAQRKVLSSAARRKHLNRRCIHHIDDSKTSTSGSALDQIVAGDG